MTVHYNVPGKARKNLAQAIGTWLEEDVEYTGVPTFAYHIGSFTIDKDGNLSVEGTSEDTVERLLEHLYDEGFECDISAATEEPAEAPSVDPARDIDSITLSFPDTGFDEDSFGRLQSLVKAKAALIEKAFDAISTEIDWNKEEKTIRFPWFKLDLSEKEDEKLAYILFLTKLMEFARTATRVTAKEKETDNAKYAFRCFLLRLGFIGDEYKGARKILLSRLSGNSAFKQKEEE